MEAMRDKWTDERLDDLSGRVDRGFERVDADIRDLRGEMSHRFERVDADIRDLRGEMSHRFDATQRLIVQVGGGLFGTMLIGFLGLVVTIVFAQH